MGERRSSLIRETKETRVSVELGLDGGGEGDISTGVPFFDHMLNSFAKHGGLDLRVSAAGDVQVDDHHTVEDVGIVLGQALREALGDKRGIARFAHTCVPMDESLARAALDISGRPYLHYEAAGLAERVGSFDTALAEEFWRAFTFNAGITLHLDLLRGGNAHHALEALFKSAGVAIRAAVAIVGGGVPSTKGAL